MSKLSLPEIESMIFQIRDQKVMLDSDLAKLYGVETKALNQAVKRNLERFPDDFSFLPNSNELSSLRSQFVTLGHPKQETHLRYTPRVFTENGVAMLSSVLKSDRAIEVNISIMRIFTKLRSFLLLEKDLSHRVSELEGNTHKLFKVVFQKLDEHDEIISPKVSKTRRKIGLKKDS